MATLISNGAPKAHGNTLSPRLLPSTCTPVCREPINIPRKSVSALNTSFSSLDNGTLSEPMSSPPRRPMSPTLGGAAAAMKKFLRRRRGTACDGDSQPPLHQQNQHPSMLQTFVLVGGIGAESGTTIYDLDHIQPSSPPLSPYSSMISQSPVAISVTKPQGHMATPPASPVYHSTGTIQSRIPTMTLRTDRGRDTHRGPHISSNRHLSPPESSNTPNSEHDSTVGHKGVLDSTPEGLQKKLRRSLSADSSVPSFQARSSSLHRHHDRRSTLGLDSAMELMLNEEGMDQSLMAKTTSWNDDNDDEGCMSAEISFSSLLATDLEMLNSLKNEHQQGGSGKRTVAKEKKKREQQQQRPQQQQQPQLQHPRKQQQKQQQPQINNNRQKSSIYQASMDFLASYHGPAHTGQGEYSAKYLKKAAEQGKHPTDWSAIERFAPDLSSKADTTPGSGSRFSSVASANSTTTMLVHTDEDGAILLVSTRPTPTQFYSALKTRKALRTLVTNNEQEFDNMLERGFLWSPVSELLDPNNLDDDDDDVLEDQDYMLPSVPPQYFMTLRITLTPWHARANESEIYGRFARRQAPMSTIIKKTSAYSFTSSISPSLSPAASATSLSLESSIFSDSGPSAPSTPPPKDESPESECTFKKATKSAPLILERSSSLLRSKKHIGGSPHASPKLTGRVLKASPPSSSVPCHPFDAPVHPFDRDSQDQSLPLRKGSLGSLSLPLPNNAHAKIDKPISLPEKSKDRLRHYTRDSTLEPSEVPRCKGSTPTIFYSPPGCNSDSELLIESQVPPKSTAPRSLSMSGTPRLRRTDYVAPSLRAAARQPSSIPVRKRSDQSDMMSANLAVARQMAEAGRPSTRAIEAWRQKTSGCSPQLSTRGSLATGEQYLRVSELNDHLPSTGQQRLHSHDKQAASYAPALPVSKTREIFCEKPEGLTKYQMDYRDSSNYSLVSPTSPPLMIHPRHQFWSSKEIASGDSDSMTSDQILDCHDAALDSRRLAQDLRYPVNETRIKSSPFTVSGVSIVPRSVHRHVVKVERGFVITNNSLSHRSSAQDESGGEVCRDCVVETRAHNE
ncbi:hypothetical protein BG003_005102 [Podila horticola]|nr:hypothetical protein BG003_005102 [Podila horticola]